HRDFMGFLRQPGDHDTPASARMRLRRALAHGFASPRHRGFALFGNRSNTDSSERTIAWGRARIKRTKASPKDDARIFTSWQKDLNRRKRRQRRKRRSSTKPDPRAARDWWFWACQTPSLASLTILLCCLCLLLLD